MKIYQYAFFYVTCGIEYVPLMSYWDLVVLHKKNKQLPNLKRNSHLRGKRNFEIIQFHLLHFWASICIIFVTNMWSKALTNPPIDLSAIGYSSAKDHFHLQPVHFVQQEKLQSIYLIYAFCHIFIMTILKKWTPRNKENGIECVSINYMHNLSAGEIKIQKK